MDYPGGDVPADKGVCTDVIIRAYRKLGIDLQKEVHEDMAANYELYPKNWGLSHTDRNIDHRRVPNLMVFFKIPLLIVRFVGRQVWVRIGIPDGVADMRKQAGLAVRRDDLVREQAVRRGFRIVAGSALGPYLFSILHGVEGSYKIPALSCLVLTLVLLILSFKAKNVNLKPE